MRLTLLLAIVALWLLVHSLEAPGETPVELECRAEVIMHCRAPDPGPVDPCETDPSLPECQPPPPVDPCDEDPTLPECQPPEPPEPSPPSYDGAWGVRPTPAWFHGLPVGEWARIGHNTPWDVCWHLSMDINPRDCDNRSPGKFLNHLDVWCGGAFSRTEGDSGTMYIGPCGGGRGSNGFGDVYAFDLATEEWRRVVEPFGALVGQDRHDFWVQDPADPVERPPGYYSHWHGHYADGQPVVAHTGHGIVVAEFAEPPHSPRLAITISYQNDSGDYYGTGSRDPMRLQPRHVSMR